MSSESVPSPDPAHNKCPIQQQFAMFVAVGIGCAGVDVGLMYALLHTGFHQVAATSLGFAAGLIFNYFLHSRMTFGVHANWPRWWRFLCVVCLNYALTLLFVLSFASLLNEPVLGKIFSLPFVALVGFFLSRRWIFQ
jgi:putative flippase GtrA